jgi:hypothetical protein
MTADQLASLAMSLRDNEAFQHALNLTRENARDGLCQANASDAQTIMHFQAIVTVVDDIRGNFEQFIRSGKPTKPPGIA